MQSDEEKVNNNRIIKHDAALDAVFGAILGCVCAYLIEYGTNEQRKRTHEIIHEIRTSREKQAQGKPQHQSEKKGKNTQVEDAKLNNELDEKNKNETFDWFSLQKRIYDVSGEFLWMHAINHWKVNMAPQMNIPEYVFEKALLKLVGQSEKDSQNSNDKVSTQAQDE